MDDNGTENQSNNRDTNDNTDSGLPIEKTDYLQTSISPANCVPNGHYKRARLALGPVSQQPSGRVVLEPIAMAKLSRSRRLSSEAVLKLADTSSKGDPEVTPSNNDDFLTKTFSNSCMEAFGVLKKAYDERLVSLISPHKVHT